MRGLNISLRSLNMLDRKEARIHNFDLSDNAIHKIAATILLSSYDTEFILTQGNYAYRVKGRRDDGHLYYRRKPDSDWVLIANWCFYGAYIVIRYRKPIWLRPMYQSLFAKMHFISVVFDDYAIELVGSDGEILRSRRLRLSPPSALREVLSEKFGYSEEKAEDLLVDLGLD